MAAGSAGSPFVKDIKYAMRTEGAWRKSGPGVSLTAVVPAGRTKVRVCMFTDANGNKGEGLTINGVSKNCGQTLILQTSTVSFDLLRKLTTSGYVYNVKGGDVVSANAWSYHQCSEDDASDKTVTIYMLFY